MNHRWLTHLPGRQRPARAALDHAQPLPFPAGAHYGIHIIDIFDNRLDLFRNKAIDRHLDVHEKRVFLDALEQDYQKRKGRWVLTSDTNANANANAAGSSQKNFFLVLWRPLEESVLAWMDRHEFDDVMLVESLVEGLGMGAWSWGEGIVLQALDVLEREKKVKVFSHRNGGKKYLALKRL